MSVFIKLTHLDTSMLFWLNFDEVAYMSRKDNETYITLKNKVLLRVKETPEKILENINKEKET